MSVRPSLRAAHHADETACVAALAETAALSPEARRKIAGQGAALVRKVRGASAPGLMESFLAEYGLSTEEGVALMCLAEALLRVPDAETIDDLIQDKIAPHDWGSHIGDSGSIMVNASTWALMLTGRVLEEEDQGVVGALRGMVRRLGEPVIRRAVGAAMREMGAAFVLGETIQSAMKRGDAMVAKGYSYSYDMLGEAARTHDDAARYFKAYEDAIAAISRRAKGNVRANPGISVKLSALHPRYERRKQAAVEADLTQRLLTLAQQAKAANIGLNVDAEEADRLEFSLDVIEGALEDPSLAGWEGFGVVVQAYQRRAPLVIEWLSELAERLDRKIMVRLVKGAYWDTEIKRAQVMGLGGYPVFTRKAATDVSYLACARRLLDLRPRIYPQFATHNAHSAAAILEMAGGARDDWEFQRLHGMGEALHEALRKEHGVHCRIYAPVGAHEDLLAYLVRRLLENGANSSFVNQIVDEDVPAETVAADPLAAIEARPGPSPAIPAPADLFAPERANARGWDFADETDLAEIEAARAPFLGAHEWGAGEATVLNPATGAPVGRLDWASADDAREAIGAAAASGWSEAPVAERARILNRVADLYEARFGEIFALLARESGKTIDDAIAELREAVDFLRYYAANAEAACDGTEARGVVVCISPWNFPLAIFTGQIAAALATGNAVVAKPAEQSPLIAALGARLMHEAGVPEDALRLVQGAGEVGAALTADPRIGGVCFTGSTETARLIDRQLATTAPEAMLIAETGGLNAMIVDSSALPEQAVRDIVASAFQSAGQRCSALRILYVQKDVAPRLTKMLFGAMEAMRLGDPLDLVTDIGPVIDAEARDGLADYIGEARRDGRVSHECAAPEDGMFIAPTALRVSGVEDLEREVFGPVLHIATFEADEIGEVIKDVNAIGYGLTFGLHTRIDRRVQDVVDAVEVGNLYVNRNQIGAIVGSQPFGGERLSGTGPKAGGPHYLARFRKARAATGAATGGDDVSAPAAKALARLADPSWARRRDRINALRDALRGKAARAMKAAAALDCGPLDLPGPTGESNRLRLAPLGRVVCFGAGEALLGHVVQALAVGDSVLAIGPDAARRLAPLKDLTRLKHGVAPLVTLDGDLPDDAFVTLPLDAVALSDPARMPGIRGALARRDGPIARLITEEIAPERFAVERALCIDTTAAGGDAHLLAQV